MLSDEKSDHRTMQTLLKSVPQQLLDGVFAAPSVRQDAVERGRRVLAGDGWCRAREVASELVDCMVARRLP